jgi:hypothetical protein
VRLLERVGKRGDNGRVKFSDRGERCCCCCDPCEEGIIEKGKLVRIRNEE